MYGFIPIICYRLLNTLLCNFAACNHIEIVRFGYNRFFLITSGKYSSGTSPLHPMGNVQVICMMGKHLSIMIVANIYASGFRQANNSRNRADSKVKVTKKVIKCKKIKCLNFDSMYRGEIPMRLWHLIPHSFRKYSERTVRAISFEILRGGGGMENFADPPSHIFIFSPTPPPPRTYFIFCIASLSKCCEMK